MNLKAIYSFFICNQFFKPLYHVAGGSSCLFFYHRHAVYQVIECRLDSCASVLCWLNFLFKTRNSYVVLMEDKVKFLLYIMYSITTLVSQIFLEHRVKETSFSLDFENHTRHITRAWEHILKDMLFHTICKCKNQN